MKLDDKTIKRFYSKIKILSNGCHQWQGDLARQGYGRLWNGITSLAAHRVAYFLKNGSISSAKVIDHICKNKACVNPDHLREVSVRTNSLENSDGLAAKNFKKTHCKNGHEFTPENTYIRKSGDKAGTRLCRRCQIDSSMRSYYNA